MAQLWAVHWEPTGLGLAEYLTELMTLHGDFHKDLGFWAFYGS